MAGVLTFDGPDGSILDLVPSDRGGALIKSVPASLISVATQPFLGTYYVDPNFVGVSTGSDANPFTTIAAAFAFAASLGITSGIVWVPQTTISENITMPTVGNWEIASPNQWGLFAAVLSGTIDVTQTASTRRAFTNLQLTGAMTGNAVAGTGRIRFTNTQVQTLVLTSAANAWRVTCGNVPGWQGNTSNGSVGAVNVAGEVYATNWVWGSTLTASGAVWLDGCLGAGPLVYSGAGANTWRLFRSNLNAGMNIGSTGGALTVVLDGTTASTIFENGIVQGTNTTFVTANANGADRRTLANNLAAQTLFFDWPLCLCTAVGSLTVLTPGTAGAAVLQVGYTDLAGAAQLKTVCGPLNIASAAGTEVAGSIQFSKGAGGVTWQVTGVVTPGALSFSAGANLRIER